MKSNDIVDSIKQQLLSKHRIDSFVFIEDLEHLPSSTLHKALGPWIKEAYEPDYRFVFFNFLPVAADTLAHVSNLITRLDISPYFVLVVTNQPATQQHFEMLPEPISVQLVDVQTTRELPNVAQPLFNVNNKMCAHAWSGLHVDPSGSTRLCCQYLGTAKDSDGSELNIKTHSMDKIFHGDYFKNIRQQFRQGQTPPGCKFCVYQESHGGESKRNLAPYKLKNIYNDIDWESEGEFTWIGGHLGNLCNLKCRICSEEYSSSIATEKLKQLPVTEVKLNQVYKTLINNNWNKKDSEFWAFIKQSVPGIKTFEFLGGEPLIVEANLDFMQYLLDNNYSQDCIFEFVTNGTRYLPIFDQAHRFKEFFISISIDNLGNKFELERSGAVWEEVDANLTKFVHCQEKNPNVKIGISITVSIQNVLYLPELINYLRSKRVNHYFINLLTTPAWISLSQLTDSAKSLVLDRLTNSDLLPEDRNKLQFVINHVQSVIPTDGELFCKNMRELDLLRKENFAETHKDIAQAMGYVLH